MKKSRLAFGLALVLSVPCLLSAQVSICIPDAAANVGTCNVIPFGQTATFAAGYTYLGRIPASFMDPINTRVDDVSFSPCGTGTWSAGGAGSSVIIGLGHIPNPQPCPFTFPNGAGSPGSFLDLTIVWNSAVNGPLNWNLTLDTFSPMFAPNGLTTTGFVWNGIDDVGFFITYLNATVIGFNGGFHRTATEPARTYAAGNLATASTTCLAASGLKMCLTASPSVGLFANFSAAPTSGAAPLAVQFTDSSFTSEPGGITSWAWDFDNNGTIDSTFPNPAHTYTAPGNFTVSLTVTDGVNAPSTRTINNLITVDPYLLVVTTTGVGDINVSAPPLAQYPGTTEGYTLVSGSTAGALGFGPLFGLTPDAFTFPIFATVAVPGNPLHFVAVPGLYPDVPFILGPGALSGLSGLTLDFVAIYLSPAIIAASNVARATL